MDVSKRARSGKLRTRPRDQAYVDSPDLQSVFQRIRQAACRENSSRTSVVMMPSTIDHVRFPKCNCASLPKAGARCGSSARRDLCGGSPERAIPTAKGTTVLRENM